jgi:YVTN family beta-propeller protein
MGVAVDRDRVYVTDTGSAAVSVIDTRTHRVVATVRGRAPGTTDPFMVALGRGAGYVTDQAGGAVSVIGTGSNRIVAVIPVGAHPYGVAVGPGG